MSRIITTSDLNTYTGKTLNSAIAKQVVDAVNTYIERQTGRVWGDTETVTEDFDYGSTIWLRRPDVQNVSAVKYGSYYGGMTLQTLQESAYYLNPRGRLSFYRGFAVPGYRMSITYTYGVDEVPADLKLAALGIASGFYNWATTGQKEVTAVQVDTYRVEYAGNRRAQDIGDTTSLTNFAVIASYKAPRV